MAEPSLIQTPEEFSGMSHCPRETGSHQSLTATRNAVLKYKFGERLGGLVRQGSNS